jgi:LPXTG-site transpeptidase (sortase) family protein
MKMKQQWKPILGGVLTMLAVLFLLNSQLIIGQIISWIHPSGSSNMSIVPDEKSQNLGADRVVIPTINVDAPLITDMRDTTESKVQASLQHGVVNFGPTALPGQGNAVVVGHSSNNVWSPGDYKFVFSLLERMKKGDKIYVVYKNMRYTYTVASTKVVQPTDISVLQPTGKSQLTLITCTPVGTSLRRFVVIADQTAPAPTAVQSTNTAPRITQLPGN